jgi:hypothetical protein
MRGPGQPNMNQGPQRTGGRPDDQAGSNSAHSPSQHPEPMDTTQDNAPVRRRSPSPNRRFDDDDIDMSQVPTGPRASRR